MKNRLTIGAVIFFLLLPPPVYAAIVINEIFPKVEDTTQEFIELYNTGDSPVSMNQWKLAETSSGKTFLINASGYIQPHSFFTFYEPQTGITFSLNGDTVTLTDDHNTVIDSQSFPSTLGFNTPMGRSPDGTGVWVICNKITPNQPNDCPPATPTPSPTPTPTPTNTPTPTPTETPTPTQELAQGLPIYRPPAMVATPTPSPTPTPPSDILVTIRVPTTMTITRLMAIQIAVVAVSWILLAVIAFSTRRHPKKHEP